MDADVSLVPFGKMPTSIRQCFTFRSSSLHLSSPLLSRLAIIHFGRSTVTKKPIPPNMKMCRRTMIQSVVTFSATSEFFVRLLAIEFFMHRSSVALKISKAFCNSEAHLLIPGRRLHPGMPRRYIEITRHLTTRYALMTRCINDRHWIWHSICFPRAIKTAPCALNPTSLYRMSKKTDDPKRT